MSAPSSDRPPPTADRGAEPLDLDTIVSRALQLPADDGMAYVKLQCTGNDLLLARAVEKLRTSAPQWWEMSIESRALGRDDGLHERTGELIGPYRVIRSLGSGG